jgi:hemolysin D
MFAMRNHGGRCKCGRRGCVSGVAQKIDATTIGQVVTSAQSLVTIVPDSTPLIVEATVSNQDIGYLKPGQAVEIKVDTFPQKYGSSQGTLAWVSADAEDKNAASSDFDTRSGAHATEEPQGAANNQNTGYVYKVHVRTEQMQFVVDGSPRRIRAGMTVQADIGDGSKAGDRFLLVTGDEILR